jgi:hypothetical protein
LNNVAVVRELLGRADEAEAFYFQALTMLQRLYPGDHPYTAGTMRNLSRCLAIQSRLPEALARAEEAAAMAARVLPESHPIRRACNDSLAEIQKKLDAVAPAGAASSPPATSPRPGG